MATQTSQHTTGDDPASELSASDTCSLIDGVYRLLDQQLDSAAFYRELTSRASRLPGASNAAAWKAAGSGAPALASQSGLEMGTLFRTDATQQQHLRLVAEVFRDGRSHAVPLVLASSDASQRGRSYVLYLQPVIVDGNVVAAIQLVCGERAGDEANLRTAPCMLAAMSAIASAFHCLDSSRGKQQSTQWMTQFEKFVKSIHASLNPSDIGHAIANDGPPLLECERMLVLVRRGRRFRVVAVTGQSTIHPRANSVRSAERLMQTLPDVDPVTLYPQASASFAPREEECLEAYLDETHAKSVAVCFFHAPQDNAAESNHSQRKANGGFIAERYDGVFSQGADSARAVLLASHGAQAVQNAKLHHGIFLLPLWLGLSRVFGSAKQHWFTSLLVAAAVLGSLAALFFVPADFDLIARGTVEPERRQHVFARVDGTIDELMVVEGQHVDEDQVLARISNPELDLELEKIVGELRTTNEKLVATKSSRLNDRSGDRSETSTDRTELAAQEEEQRQWIASLERQLKLLEQQRRDLLVRSPIAGEIMTWNIDPVLRQRPVRRGQLLMTVADLNGPWGLELFLPDRHVGHFLETSAQSNQPLDVEFTLATNPNDQYVGQIKETAKSIRFEEQDGASLLVTAAFDRSALKFVQPGATVTAKIRCGKRPLGYVWLHDLWSFLQYRVFFRF